MPTDELFARVEHSVVTVNVTTLEGTGNGSGFIIDSSGIAVTNYHVMANSTKAWLEFSDDERIPVDGILFLDHRKDIAILKFDPTKRSRTLQSLPLASALPRKGVKVAAIGAPLGLDMTITEGVVSAVRTVEELEQNIGLRGHDGTWVQTTAAISPGNSGGPLLNLRCEVLSINTLVFVGDHAQAMNFGISCVDIADAMSKRQSTPMPVSPLTAPKREITGEVDRSGGREILDVSGTPDGQKRLAELKKVTILFGSLAFQDPFDVVTGTVRSEANQVLERLKIDQNLISNEESVLLIVMKLDQVGGKLTLFITAHVMVRDDSSGRPQALKLWEKTGEVGTTTQQALLQGNMSQTLKKKIVEFFGKLRADVIAARKAYPAGTP